MTAWFSAFKSESKNATFCLLHFAFQVNANSKNQKLVLGVVCAALFPNVVQVVKPDVKYKASATGEQGIYVTDKLKRPNYLVRNIMYLLETKLLVTTA